MYKLMKDQTLQLRVSSELKALLSRTSEVEGRAMAKIAREAIELYCSDVLGHGLPEVKHV
jgi:predicted DNA-binding protein